MARLPVAPTNTTFTRADAKSGAQLARSRDNEKNMPRGDEEIIEFGTQHKPPKQQHKI